MSCSTPRFLVLHYIPELVQTHVHLVDDAIQTYHPVVTFSSCPQSFQASGAFPVSLLFASGDQSIGASASVLPVNIQKWLIWSPCSPRDSQESSPAPQFKSINSSTLSFLHSPTPTSIHDHWKNHSVFILRIAKAQFSFYHCSFVSPFRKNFHKQSMYFFLM